MLESYPYKGDASSSWWTTHKNMFDGDTSTRTSFGTAPGTLPDNSNPMTMLRVAGAAGAAKIRVSTWCDTNKLKWPWGRDVAILNDENRQIRAPLAGPRLDVPIYATDGSVVTPSGGDTQPLGGDSAVYMEYDLTAPAAVTTGRYVTVHKPTSGASNAHVIAEVEVYGADGVRLTAVGATQTTASGNCQNHGPGRLGAVKHP